MMGLDRQGVAIVGAIPARLPGFSVPPVTWELTLKFTESALAIAVLGLLEALAMAKAIAAQTGQRLDIGQQCLSEGVANLTGSFFHCFPGSGSLTRSAINQQAGAVSQWSGVVCAASVAAIMLLFAPLAQYIPSSALAGLLILTGWRMVDRHQLNLPLAGDSVRRGNRRRHGLGGRLYFGRVLHLDRRTALVRALRAARQGPI